jgi:putative copper export protein
MKFVIIAFLVVIVASLASALYYLIRDREKGGSDRTVKALTVRITLSIALFIILMVSYSRPGRTVATRPHPRSANTTTRPRRRSGDRA